MILQSVMKMAVAAALLAVVAGCTDKQAAPGLEPAADPGDLDTVLIESADEAYERASEAIDVDNFDDELDKLEKELEDDPYVPDRD